MASVFELMAVLTLNSSAYDKGLSDAKDNASTLGGAIKGAAKVAGTAFAAVEAAAVTFTKKSVAAGAQFDKSMSQVAATMGNVDDMSGEALGKLREYASGLGVAFDESTSATELSTNALRAFAQEMGSKTAFSASQAADALNYMALAGYDATTSIDMLPNVLNLAAAGSMGLADASDMITDASSALGLTIEETADMVDQMAKASSKSNTSVSQLGDAILSIGGTAKGLTGGTVELSTALGILADNGIKGAEGGTALRNILLNLTPKSEDAAEAMERIGLNAYNADGELRPLADIFRDMNAGLADMSTLERQNIIGGIFNKVDLKSVNALLAASGDKVAMTSEALEESGVAWEKYADKVWAAGENISDGVIDDLIYNISEIGTSTEDLRDYLHFEYDLDYEDADKAIASVTAKLENQSDRWDELSGFIANAEGAAQQMADTQLDNLSGDVVIFQSALEGAQIALSDTLVPAMREFVQFGTKGLSSVTEAFRTGGLEGAMDALGDIITDLLGMLIDKIPEFLNAGMSILRAIVKGIINNAPAIGNAAVTIVKNFTKYMSKNWRTILKSGVEIVARLASGIINGIPKLMASANDLLSGFLDELGNPAELFESGGNIIIDLIEGINNNLPAMITQAGTMVSKLVKKLIDSAPQMIDAGFKLMQRLAGGVGKAIPEIAKAATGVASQIIHAIASGIPAILDKGREIISSIGAVIKEKIPILSPIVDGIGTVFDFAFGAIETAINGLVTFWDETLLPAINDVAGWFGGLYEAGAEGGLSGVADYITTTFSEAWGKFSDWFSETSIGKALSDVSDWFDGLIDSTDGGIASVASYITTTFSDAWGKFSDWFAQTSIGQTLSDVGDWFSGLVGEDGPLKDVTDFITGTFASAWAGVTSLFSDDSLLGQAISTVKGWFNGLVGEDGPLKSVSDFVSGTFFAAWNGIRSLFNDDSLLGQSIALVKGWFNGLVGEDGPLKIVADFIVGTFTSAWDGITSLFSDGSLLGQAISTVKGWFNGLISEEDGPLKLVSDFITGTFTSAWNGITSLFEEGQPLRNAIDAVGTAFETMKATMLPVYEWLSDTFSPIFGTIQGLMDNLNIFIATLFSTGWSNAWNGITTKFKNLFNTIIEYAKTPINAVIGLINSMIEGIETAINFVIGGVNSISFTIPDWVPGIGGDSFGINLDLVSFGRIPLLANGGILSRGSVVVGDAGPELLSMLNGKAVVQPLTGGYKNDQNQIHEDLQELGRKIESLQIVLDTGAIAGELVGPLDDRLARRVTFNTRRN